MINKVNIDFEIDKVNCLIYAYCTVKCNGKTGVEMEALTGVNICLLTIYDMCKAVSKDMEIKMYIWFLNQEEKAGILYGRNN